MGIAFGGVQVITFGPNRLRACSARGRCDWHAISTRAENDDKKRLSFEPSKNAVSLITCFPGRRLNGFCESDGVLLHASFMKIATFVPWLTPIERIIFSQTIFDVYRV
jgi:hypothetical protein